MSKTKQTNGATQPKAGQGEQKKEWVFTPLSKELILKSTDKYILIKLPEGATAIVSAVFKRKKETKETIFLSVPPEYKFSCQRREYDAKKGKYIPVNKWELSPQEVKDLVTPKFDDNPDSDDLPDDDLPF